MLKTLFTLFVLFVLSLFARENPFVSVQSAQTMGEATSIKKTLVPFEKQSINLPSSARILKSMELHYQNLDGSVESTVVNIEKEIDWHDTLVLQKNTPTIETTAIIPMEHKKVQETQTVKEAVKKSINFLNILHVDMIEKNIWLKTKDKKLRDFLVTSPYKIVVDFERDLSFRTKEYPLDIKPFEKLVVGNHAGYYRVVFELDGQYRYDISKTDEGYFIRLK